MVKETLRIVIEPAAAASRAKNIAWWGAGLAGRGLWPTLVLIVALAAGALAADTVTVSQRDRQFHPGNLQIARGTTIRIVNDDKVTHHIYIDAPQMKFDSGEQPVGTTVELQFDHAGNFAVRCAIHPTMRLQVTVE